MPWTTPSTWVNGTVVGATDLNTQLRDNLNYLLSGTVTAMARSGTNTSTSSTTFVAMDATNLTASLTAVASRVFFALHIPLYISTLTNYMYIDFAVNGVRIGNATKGVFGWDFQNVVSGTYVPACFVGFASVTPGAVTVVPQWRVDGGVGGAINTNGYAQLIVWEE